MDSDHKKQDEFKKEEEELRETHRDEEKELHEKHQVEEKKLHQKHMMEKEKLSGNSHDASKPKHKSVKSPLMKTIRKNSDLIFIAGILFAIFLFILLKPVLMQDDDDDISKLEAKEKQLSESISDLQSQLDTVNSKVLELEAEKQEDAGIG